MNRKELFKQLNSLCEELNYKYNINRGGCCFVAAVIAEQLESYNIPFSVIHYDMWGCHYAIRVSDRIINRDDYKSNEISREMTSEDYFLLSDELYDIYYSEDWNKSYSKKCNLIVKTKIKSLFKKYGNSRT